MLPEDLHATKPWVLGNVRGKELQDDEPAEFCVPGLVHHTHPAAAQLFHDAVMRNSLADHGERKTLETLMAPPEGGQRNNFELLVNSGKGEPRGTRERSKRTVLKVFFGRRGIT